jgi:hypothetical protein
MMTHTLKTALAFFLVTMTACSAADEPNNETIPNQLSALGAAGPESGGTPPGSAPAVAGAAQIEDCATADGYETSTFATGQAAGVPQVHVIGVYETRADHAHGEHPRGAATVRVEQPGRHVLVLSAYEPTDFEIVAANGAIVEKVVLVGYHPHTAKAPSDAVILDRSGEREDALRACGYTQNPEDGDGCDTPRLLADVRSSVGEITSFAGCYRATSFVIGRSEAAPPGAPAPPAPPPAPSEPGSSLPR